MFGSLVNHENCGVCSTPAINLIFLQALIIIGKCDKSHVKNIPGTSINQQEL